MRSSINGRSLEPSSGRGLNNGDGSLANRNIECISCGASFIFSVGEQIFYKTHRIPNIPQRCKSCRDERFREKLSKGYPVGKRRWVQYHGTSSQGGSSDKDAI